MSDHISNMIGVDISKAHLDAHALPSGRAARFANNAAGIRKLAAWAGPAECVVYESTGPWHRAFEEPLAGELPLARVNALRAALRAGAGPGGEDGRGGREGAGQDGRGDGTAARGADDAGAARSRRTADGARRAGAGQVGKRRNRDSGTSRAWHHVGPRRIRTALITLSKAVLFTPRLDPPLCGCRSRLRSLDRHEGPAGAPKGRRACLPASNSLETPGGSRATSPHPSSTRSWSSACCVSARLPCRDFYTSRGAMVKPGASVGVSCPRRAKRRLRWTHRNTGAVRRVRR